MQLLLPIHITAEQGFSAYHPGINQSIVDRLQDCVTETGEPFIFLCGPSGLGKTHLLQSCCRLAHERQHHAAYLPMQLLRQYGPECLDNLDTLDLVCADNLDVITGQAELEQAFLHFSECILTQGNRLIVAAPQAPTQLPICLPKLRHHLSSGLTLPLNPLGDEDTLTALRLKARQLGFQLPIPVGHYILTHYARDLPSLWPVLQHLDQVTLTRKKKLTIPFIRQQLDQLSAPVRA